ncbi:hypothetical protein HDU96_011020 [Phlyctochytrium bullatum]|nr:hypothetical protein HDU96_011020 [Phlyctochytrium bullatum]
MRFATSLTTATLAALSAFQTVVVTAVSTPPPEIKLGARATSDLKPFASTWNTTGNNYPIVMVHGLLGWGEKPLLNLMHYWGGLDNFVADLRAEGYSVHQPTLGPASSNWERACELYAQISGTVVDYGIARSKKFGHARFGRNHTGQGLYPDWGKAPGNKIHLIGHSMGGPTGRMLTHLMAHGSAEEVAAAEAAGVPVSPLFYTNKTSSYIHSFTSIAVKNSEDTYYFSLAGDTTFGVLFNQVARPDTNLFLQPTANLIGAYTNHTLFGGNSFAWRTNDGLVPVVSSQGDDLNGFVPYQVNLYASTERMGRALAARRTIPSKGTFHYLQTMEAKDHLGLVGMLDPLGMPMGQVYRNIASLISSLPPQ